jgi:TetR/AcrR family transcriptional regulator, regulator of cefoperazone and chloramphenicol sensitivity
MSDHQNPAEQPDTIEEKLIYATIACMEKYGMEALTTRNIAKEADLNIASINYYFRSKDKLVEAALEYSIKQAFEDIPNFIDIEDGRENLNIAELFKHFMTGIFQYPGITKAHLYNPIMKGDFSGVFVSRFSRFLHDISDRLCGVNPKLDKKETTLRLIAAFSAIILSGLLAPAYKEHSGIDLETSANQAALINIVTEYIK